MTTFDKIKYYYDKGIYKEAHIRVFVEKNVLTPEEYESIVGKPYVKK